MTLEEDIKRLEELAKASDYEHSHGEADDILLNYVPEEIKKAYLKVGRWFA